MVDSFLYISCEKTLILLLDFFFRRCRHLSAEWEELEEACTRRAAHLSKAITREQVRDSRMWLLRCHVTEGLSLC